jgi:hypothetical protein
MHAGARLVLAAAQSLSVNGDMSQTILAYDETPERPGEVIG